MVGFLGSIGVKALQDLSRFAHTVRAQSKEVTRSIFEGQEEPPLSLTEWVVLRSGILDTQSTASTSHVPQDGLLGFLKTCTPPLLHHANALYNMGITYYDIRLLVWIPEQRIPFCNYLLTTGIFDFESYVAFLSRYHPFCSPDSDETSIFGVLSFVRTLGLNDTGARLVFIALFHVNVRSDEDLDDLCTRSQNEIDEVLDRMEGVKPTQWRALLRGLEERARLLETDIS